MKIIQINCVYPNGSTGKIVYDLHTSLLEKGYESTVFFGNGKKVNDPLVYKTYNDFYRKLNTLYTYITGKMYSGSMYSTRNIIKKIREEKPDIVHLHSINGHMVNIYKLLNFLNTNKINTVITNHAEFFYTGSYTHVPENSTQWLTGRKEKYPGAKKLTNSLFFDKTHYLINRLKRSFDNFSNLTVTSVSPWVDSRSRKSFVLRDKLHKIVLNGIDVESLFYPRKIKDMKQKLNLDDNKIVLHVTSGVNNPLKGFDTVIALAKKLPDYTFIIIGADVNQKNILPKNCINIGKIYDQNKLAEFYSLADLTLLTSKKETFSMIVAESLSCGTPVVGYNAGGPESIAIKNFTEFIPYGEIDTLKNKIQKWIDYKQNNKDFSIIARSKYSKIRMVNTYINVYKQLIKNHKLDN